MKITSAEFIISAVKPDQYPTDGLPEVALAGRSNVGKSSFINCLINRKNLARTSSKPGKTQTLNYYKVNEQFYFVDVPGYGYAKVSKKERETWGRMLDQYLTTHVPLLLVLVIVDLRHPPSVDDCQMVDYLLHYKIPFGVIATKADKIPKGKREKQIKIIKETLNLPKYVQTILFSAEEGLGKEAAWRFIFSHMK